MVWINGVIESTCTQKMWSSQQGYPGNRHIRALAEGESHGVFGSIGSYEMRHDGLRSVIRINHMDYTRGEWKCMAEIVANLSSVVKTCIEHIGGCRQPKKCWLKRLICILLASTHHIYWTLANSDCPIALEKYSVPCVRHGKGGCTRPSRSDFCEIWASGGG